MISVLVTGDREWHDRWWIEGMLRGLRLQAGEGGMHLVEGCARGADKIACTWGDRQQNLGNRPFKIHHCSADWARYGKAAGPRRNREMLKLMLDLPSPRFVLAFHDDLKSQSKGTRDMVDIARKAGIAVRLHSHLWEKDF